MKTIIFGFLLLPSSAYKVQEWIEWQGSRIQRIKTTARGWLESCNEVQTYTVLRTHKKAGVALSLHIERLQDGARHYGAPPISEESIREAISAVMPSCADGIIVIAINGQGILRVISRSAQTIEHEIVPFTALAVPSGSRPNPFIKTSQWCHDRKPLEKFLNKENEILLTTKDSKALLEGLTHNACIITKSGIIQTAPSHVLPGVGLAHALDAARRLHMPIRRRFPKLVEMDSWKEIFLTNANILCVPVASLTTQYSPSLTFCNDDFTISNAIRETMLGDIINPTPNSKIAPSNSSWLEPVIR